MPGTCSSRQFKFIDFYTLVHDLKCVSGFNQQDHSDAFVTCFSTGCWTWTDSVCISFVSSSGRKCYRLVVMSFGLLCILQAALNISLRLLLCESLVFLLLRNHYSHQGWIYFQSSFYYISTIRKTWHESRDDCLQRGADLMIINSREEQLFTMRLKDEMWIGLKDSKTVEKWKWVDGTPLTNRFTHYSLIHIHITKGFKELVLWPCLTHI
uniref:C-type lectin domain-containing protein n=1 Tax=Monopterus albus TaxID=43700 RepID=A0A3Q3IP21_MONAL